MKGATQHDYGFKNQHFMQGAQVWGDSMGIILAGALTGALNGVIKCSELFARIAFPASLLA